MAHLFPPGKQSNSRVHPLKLFGWTLFGKGGVSSNRPGYFVIVIQKIYLANLHLFYCIRKAFLLSHTCCIVPNLAVFFFFRMLVMINGSVVL